MNTRSPAPKETPRRPAGSVVADDVPVVPVVPVVSVLPVAVRAHAVRHHTTDPKSPPDVSSSGQVLVFDTETTVDPAQGLTFGCWRYYRVDPQLGWVCVEEGLFHADDLEHSDPAGYATLRAVAARSRSAAAGGGNLRLLSRAEFVNRVFYPAAWNNKATVVGFNLPFDLSRIAINTSEGRRGNVRGFSFTLARGNIAKGYREQRHRPRVQVKHLNSHAAFIGFGAVFEPPVETVGWRGQFVDLRTLTFALTGEGHGLDSACEAFGLPGKDDPDEHGRITPDYIDYCRRDVECTANLYRSEVAELAGLNLPISPAKAFSPASLAKATLEALGVTGYRERTHQLPPQVLGWFMSAFYGGRAECRIRRTEVPVALVDFTSMYPTVFELMGLWDYYTADRLDTVEATEQVRTLLGHVTLDHLFDPDLWPNLVGIALVDPNDDVLPVRARYDPRKTSWNIGVNHLTSTTPMWYTIPDLVAATILTGRPPRIRKALRLTHHERLGTLTGWTMPGDRVLDPTRQAPWTAMIEHRHRVRADPSLPEPVRQRVQLFFKITANAGGYGINAEYNRHDLPTGQRRLVDVYSHPDVPFTTAIGAPEDPGAHCCPPLAAVITAAARLMLAMLERCVTDAAGVWAFADTDSMAIVASPRGRLVECPGGPHRNTNGDPCVRALSYRQVNQIRDRFTALNPYDPQAVPGGILKHELNAYCYAVAAKRYALYCYHDGKPRLVPADEHQPCSHGLGHLLNPTDPNSEDRDWVVAFWEHHLTATLTNHPHLAPDWWQHPALGKIAITSPATFAQLARYNRGRSYETRVKPFGFLLHAPGAQTEDNPNGQLVAPYTNQPADWLDLDWTDLAHPGRLVKITTDPTQPGRALIDTYATIADSYFTHREAKAANPDTTPADRASTGLLGRRHVRVGSISIIGKEANDIEDRAVGLVPDVGSVPAVTNYTNPNDPEPNPGISPDQLKMLQHIGAPRLAQMTGRSTRRIGDVLRGQATPHDAMRVVLLQALHDHGDPPM